MKIKLSLNEKSIDNAIKQFETAKKQLKDNLLTDFYLECYNYFVKRANFYLSTSDIGDLVILDISNSWRFERTTTGAKFLNNAEKAVYVEFGVGIVGKQDEHPMASENSYEYNTKTPNKLYDDSWIFKSYEDELDIPNSAIISSNLVADGRMRILTRGTKGCFYAFNALDDLRLEMANIWKRVKIKYWG